MNFLRPDAQNRTLRFLLLEDSALDAELVSEHLQGVDLVHVLDRVVTRDEFVAAVTQVSYDLILADYALPSFDGMSALSIAQEICPDTPFVFVSATLGEEVAIEALKRGATDYVLKQRLERLPGTVLRALAEAGERAERLKAQQALHRLFDQKTVLLHELDHRVKNNLQVLLSLVTLEIRGATSTETKQVLARLKRRLAAMAAVHRQLYGVDDLAEFDAAEVVRELAGDLAAASGREDITAEYELQPVYVSASKAVPLALLLNELLSNALAHAYDHRHGKLRLILRPDHEFCIVEIGDHAFSQAEKEGARTGTTAGILNGLARQLSAEVEWPEAEPSILVRATFPISD
ncbi:MAG TPA: histidine kinase dimerization/phosphoacceptor domain -containing protein [Microvirga sp.]|jgi:two-component sensor histidine kinase|nr:histidine kinase dimerization/phosphoacceptor domain -containing protein [Microvirga sp.]